MQIKSELDKKIRKWRLLEHPFYQAWSAGTITMGELKTYAEEYGSFISLIPDGWGKIGDDATVEEEIEHIELWERFSDSLGGQAGGARLESTKRLTDTARKLFSTTSTALGGLYAFEAQQPETATSKLAGLIEFYNVSIEALSYFETHAANEHESVKLMARMADLDETEKYEAVEGCEQMSKALWDALTGIQESEGV